LKPAVHLSLEESQVEVVVDLTNLMIHDYLSANAWEDMNAFENSEDDTLYELDGHSLQDANH